MCPRRQGTTQRRLTDHAQTEDCKRSAQRQPGANRGAHAVTHDHGESGLLEIEIVGHFPQSAALVADRQEFRAGVVAGKADTIAGLPAGDVFADRQDCPRGAVAGAEGEFPVGQVRILKPLMRAGVDCQLGAGADAAIFGGDQNLIFSRVGEIDLAHVDGECFGDNGLTGFHGGASLPDGFALAKASG